MEFTEVIRNRYSCKNYSDRQVDATALNHILEAGRVAPTAKNLQEQHIYVLQTEKMLAKIDAATPCRYNAPTVLVVTYNESDTYTYPGERHFSGVEDATIVATHMILAACNEGVDSCWLNRFDPDELERSLALPRDERIVMLMDLGYAAEGTGPLPNHGSRKELSETVTFL